MNDYINKTLNKINELLNLYPDAELRFGRHLSLLENCKILESDIKYNIETNTIYIGF